MRAFLVAIVTAVVAASLSGAATLGSSTGDYTDQSGLKVIGASHDRVVPEALRDAYAAYDALSEANPNDFGYASPNLVNGTVSMPSSWSVTRTS